MFSWLGIVGALLTPAGPDGRLSGFSVEASSRQHRMEAVLLELPDAETFRSHLERITREPHVSGTPANARVADYIAEQMTAAGFGVERFEYDVYMPTPDNLAEVSIVTPVRLPLNNQEFVLEADRYSGAEALGPGWNAYSGSGEAEGEVVYANYGRREDFARLRELGIQVAGRIVIARYGGNFRGYKARYAQAADATALIIYSDPANGGYVAGPEYPEGPFLTASTVQRGSVLTLPYAGDPLTPFVPALPATAGGPERLDPRDVAFHEIPVIPIPHGSAIEVLERMEGPAVPQDWQGGCPSPTGCQGVRPCACAPGSSNPSRRSGSPTSSAPSRAPVFQRNGSCSARTTTRGASGRSTRTAAPRCS